MTNCLILFKIYLVESRMYLSILAGFSAKMLLKAIFSCVAMESDKIRSVDLQLNLSKFHI